MTILLRSALLLFSLVLFGVEVNAQVTAVYSKDKAIALPGDGSFDYLFTDEDSRRLYVSHGTQVQVLDLNTESLIGTIDGMQGVHGIAVVKKSGKGFITDGKANAVQVFDLSSFKLIKTIQLSGKKPDAIIFDEFTNQVFAFNSGSNNASVIDVNKLEEIKLVELGGAPEFGVSDSNGKIYNNSEDKNHTVIIDAKSLTITDSISLSPNGGPTALAYDRKNKRLFCGCREGNMMAVMDPANKKVIATLPICKSVDAIVYDAGTKLIYCSGDGTTTIIKQNDADKYEVVQTLTTKIRAKTMAIDKKTKKIYLSSADYEPGTKKIIPGSFSLLVFKMN